MVPGFDTGPERGAEEAAAGHRHAGGPAAGSTRYSHLHAALPWALPCPGGLQEHEKHTEDDDDVLKEHSTEQAFQSSLTMAPSEQGC